MGDSLTRALIAEVRSWSIDDLDAADLSATGELLLDHLAVAAFGSTIEAGRIAHSHAVEDRPVGRRNMPIVGTSSRADPIAAGLANAVAASCYEFDDTYTAGSAHPGSVIFPAALAAAAISGCDGATFVRAVVVGYEVMCRVALAVNPHAHRARHFHPTATTGHFGAAAAAAICLGLDEVETLAALSLAGTAAGGNMQFVLEGGWTKQLHPGYAVERGIGAVQLARRGFPGVADPIGGPRAFLASQSDHPRPAALLEGLGSGRRQVRDVGIKPYPSCRNTQSPLDALLTVRRDLGVDAEEVAAITFGLIRPGVATVFEPADRRRRPTTLAEAQFSMPFVAAVAMVDGRVGLEQLRAERILDASLHPLMDVVTCVHDPALDDRYPAAWPAWAEVQTTARGTFRAEVEHPRGDPANPLSATELDAKVEELTAGIWGPERRQDLADEINRLPEAADVDRLLELTVAD